jgi:predicted negative regulator of RcsB-dependent stress response
VADYQSEEEQIEAFKQWWVDNGLKLVASAVVVIGVAFGWQGWQGAQEEQAQQGSAIYTNMIDTVKSSVDAPLTEEQQEAVSAAVSQLKEEFSDSGYAHLSALVSAKLAVEADDLDTAVTELEWVLSNQPSDTLAILATLRLARVEAARGNIETALALIEDADAGKMVSAYEEAKGDFHISMGHYEAAYTAYQAAINAEESGNARLLSILRLKLSEAKPVKDSAANVTKASEGES